MPVGREIAQEPFTHGTGAVQVHAGHIQQWSLKRSQMKGWPSSDYPQTRQRGSNESVCSSLGLPLIVANTWRR